MDASSQRRTNGPGPVRRCAAARDARTKYFVISRRRSKYLVNARIDRDGSRELLFASRAADRSPARLSYAYMVRVSNPPVPSSVAFVVPFPLPPHGAHASRQGGAGAGATLFPFPAPSCPLGVLILEFEGLSLPVENV